jgi:hypothetical protein
MSLNLYASPGERTQLIAGLYDLAKFLEDNPEVPTPRTITVHVFPPTGMTDAERRAEIDAIAARLGVTARKTGCGHYVATRSIGPVEYRAVAIPPKSGSGNRESE